MVSYSKYWAAYINTVAAYTNTVVSYTKSSELHGLPVCGRDTTQVPYAHAQMGTQNHVFILLVNIKMAGQNPSAIDLDIGTLSSIVANTVQQSL